MTIIVHIINSPSGTKTPHDGRWLVAWDSNSKFGELHVTSTADKARAAHFTSGAEVLAEWRADSLVDPIRPDGRPNRPLTALSVMTEELSP